jgi:plastin-1
MKPVSNNTKIVLVSNSKLFSHVHYSPSMVATVDTEKLKWKLPQLKTEEINSLVARFNQCKLDSTDHIDQRELITLCQSLSGAYTYDDVRDAIKRADITTSGKVDVEEFLEVYITSNCWQVVVKLRDSSTKSSVTTQDKLGRRRTVMLGKQAGTAHTINEDEKVEFVQHINFVLQGDRDLKKRIPVEPLSMQIFDEARGLCFYCNGRWHNPVQTG